jgi:hypothetical protein
VTAPITVESDLAIVAVGDSSLALPSAPDQDALLRELEPLARAGRIFYLVADDPVRCRIGLVAGAPPAELGAAFEPSAGTFGLDLPGGTLALHGWSRGGAPVLAGTFAAAPGRHALSILARRPFEGSRHAEEMRALLGPEWAHMERVKRLGLVGCLPLLATAGILLARKWSWLWLVVPLLALSWAPYVILKTGRRYREAERRARELEEARPHYVLCLVPGGDGLPGGFVRM